LVFDYMNDDIIDPAKEFLDYAIKERGNSFLTGVAGTGKSYNLRKFVQSGAVRADVCASTGVAALNVSGSTIHRFTGMLIGPSRDQKDHEYYSDLLNHPYHPLKRAQRRIGSCSCLVIDEISMLPGRQLDFVNYLFKEIRGSSRPFGGCQVILIGDFLQLPPVRRGNDPYDWAFTSKAWEEAGFKMFQLQKIHRQDEPNFVQALCGLRMGKMTWADAKLMSSRVTAHPNSEIVRLFTHNLAVEKWNNLMLGDLPGEEKVFKASLAGPESETAFLVKNLLTPEELHLKPGALVAFTVNKYDYENGGSVIFVNGQQGRVVSINDYHIVVESNGHQILVSPHTWKFDPRKDEGGSFTQFPLRLAYALSIHKSQGLTLDNAYVDIRAAREPGQAYTACSRVRTLAGLHFKEWPKICFTSEKAVQFYESGKINTVADKGVRLVSGNPF